MKKLGVIFLFLLIVSAVSAAEDVVSLGGGGTPEMYFEEIQTCSGNGEVIFYTGDDPFQSIYTEFTTTRNQLLVFARGNADLSAWINDAPEDLDLEIEVFNPFHVRVYSLETESGDEITIDGSYFRNARGVQGFITQDVETPVFDLDTFEVVYDDFQENDMFLTPGNYNFVIFDKYTINRPGQGIDYRDVDVTITGDSGTIFDETYDLPYPAGTQGGVVDNYFINDSGNYTLSIDTDDSIYWPLISCPEPEPFCGDGILQNNEECDDGNNENGDGCSEYCETEVICEEGELIEINFNEYPAGTVVYDQYLHLGLLITAINNNDDHPDEAILFDSSNPTGQDEDLGTPNEAYGGPGVGSGENAGIGNDLPYEKVLIIAEDLVDGNGDDLVDDPDDEGAGGKIIFEWDKKVEFKKLHLIDIEEPGGYVEATYEDLVALQLVSAIGDNSVQKVEFDAFADKLVVDFESSGAVDNIKYCEFDPVCGNGILEEGEECDDGNLIDGDGCSSQCTLEFCGDGIVNPPEMCELPGTNDNPYCFQNATECDGNKTGTRDNYGYCDFSCGCQEDPFEYVCVKDSCGATCEADIDCDDGNIHTIDTCSLDSCGCEHEYIPYCGDGIVDFGEECDLGIDNGLVCVPEYMGTCTYCDGNCSNVTIPGPFCGDGILEPLYEQCDDGNNIDGDGCDAFCNFEIDICEVNITYNGSYYVDNETDWIDTNSSVDFYNETTNETCEPYDNIRYNNNWIVANDYYCESTTNCLTWNESNFSNDTWETYNGSFSGGEESCHVIEYVTQNENQVSEVKWDCIFVDKTPPVTESEYGEPYFVDEETWQQWIGIYTPIWLTAYDPEPHPSGVDKTHYRITRVDDEYCYEPHDLCENATGNGSWYEWNGTNLTVGEESCHLIEYYSIDNVDKVEELNKECVFVDDTPPVPIKEVGEPYTLIHVEDYVWNFYPEVNGRCWNGEEDSIDCWDVTMMTPISMTCEDQLPHPVGTERVCFNVGLDGDDATEDYCEYYEGTYDENGDGFCCLDSVIEEFYFNELSEHNLKFYCEDALGNIGEIDDEKFKVRETAFSIWLNKKWNLISTPVKLTDDSLTTIFDNISNETISVTTYDAFEDKWYVFTPDGDDTNDDLHTMLPGWGYWVLMDEEAELLLAGNLLEPAIPPPYKPIKGDAWNLIGYYGAEGLDYYHGPAGAGGNADCELNTFRDSIWDLGFTSLFTYWEPDNPNVWIDLDRFDNMDPGAGYWVFSTQDGVYAPETGCVGFVPSP